MTTPQNESKTSLYLSYSILGVIFVLDSFLVLGMFGGIPYVVGLVVLMWLLKPSEVMYFSGACGVLAIAAFLISEDLSDMSGLLNRFMAIFANVAIAMLVKRYTEVVSREEEQRRHLNSVVEKRTEGLKQVVDQLEENKIRLTEAEQLGHFGFWEYYPATQEMIWSNGVFAIYGFPITPKAPSMQEFLDQCHTEDVQILQRSIQYGLAEKKPYTVEYRLIMPDGSVKWIFNKGRPIVGPNGTVDLLVGTIQDVTNLKHSEESALANRARYTTLFKSAGVAKVLMIPNKRILEANQAFARWVGYSEKSLMKIPLEKLMHEDDRSKDHSYAREMISGEIDFYQKEKRFVRRDGTILWGLFSVSPVFDAEDKIACFAAEIVDITGHKNLQLAFQKAQDSWHEAEDALTESENARRLAESNLKESEAARRLAEAHLQQYVQQGPPPASGEERTEVLDTPLASLSDELEPGEAADAGDATDGVSFEGYSQGDYDLSKFEQPDVSPTLPDRTHSPEHGPASVQEQTAPMRIKQPAANTASTTNNGAGQIKPLTEEVVSSLLTGRDLIALIGLDSCYKHVSPRLTSELGYGEGELDDQNFLNFIHQEDRVAVQEHFMELRRGVSVSGLQLRHLTKFEGYRRFMWSASLNEEYDVIVSNLKLAIEFDFGEPAPSPQSTPVQVPPASDPVEAPPEDADPALETPETMQPASQADAGLEPPLLEDDTLIIPEAPEPEVPQDEPLIPQPAEVLKSIRKPRAPRAPLPEKQTELVPPPLQPASAREVDWHRLTDRMPFQVWMLGKDGACRYVNKKVRDFTGLPFEQLEGKGWSKTVHPDDYRGYVAYYKSVFENWEPMACMYRLRRNDGTYRWMQESSVPLQKPDGTYEGYLVTCMEVTMLHNTGEKFTQAFRGAVNLVDLKSALHPCQRDESQHIITDSVKIGDALVANAREVPNVFLARLMAYAGQRLLHMVREILSFDHADKDDHDLLEHSVSLDEVLESTVEMLAPLRKLDGTRFQIIPGEKEMRVRADKVLVHRVFENLLRNLLDWSESRVITLEAYESENHAVVEIRHIGQVLNPGFLMELDNIFRKGATSLLQRKAGLELSLIKRLAEAMDGGMRVLLDEDKDPMIEIWFDQAAPEAVEDRVPDVEETRREESPDVPAGGEELSAVADAIATISQPEPPAQPEAPMEEDILIHENGANGRDITRHRVLVGETNSETQRLVRSLLQPYYDLTIVPSTDDLLKQADAAQFDLLLLDVHLQGDHSGVDVLKELRRRPQYTRTPAIAVATNITGIDQRELMDRAGFDGFLRKPYSIVELLETVERMIES